MVSIAGENYDLENPGSSKMVPIEQLIIDKSIKLDNKKSKGNIMIWN